MSKEEQGPRPADPFVAFRISVYLARTLPLVSPYQLERRVMPNCPNLWGAAARRADQPLLRRGAGAGTPATGAAPGDGPRTGARVGSGAATAGRSATEATASTAPRSS